MAGDDGDKALAGIDWTSTLVIAWPYLFPPPV